MYFVDFLSISKFNFRKKNCEIISHYNDFIRIEKKKYENNEYLTRKIIKSKNQLCFSELFENTRYVEYLLTTFPSRQVYVEMNELVESGADSNKLQNEFIKKLQNDSTFNAVMSELVQKSIDKKIQKDTFSMDYFLNIAVKFFKIVEINENNKYSIQIRIGINGMKDTEIKRNPQVEAFVFAIIFTKFSRDILMEVRDELYKINLGIGINNEEALLRAQGALYFLLRNNQDFKDFFTTEYEENKDLLPFVISG